MDTLTATELATIAAHLEYGIDALKAGDGDSTNAEAALTKVKAEIERRVEDVRPLMGPSITVMVI